MYVEEILCIIKNYLIAQSSVFESCLYYDEIKMACLFRDQW